jgi:hypothetical protein
MDNVDTIVMERLTYGVQQSLRAEGLKTAVEIDGYMDHLSHQVVARFMFSIYGRDAGEERVSWRWPLNWWEHYKEERSTDALSRPRKWWHLRRRFWCWYIRKRPVKYQSDGRSVRTFHSICPHLNAEGHNLHIPWITGHDYGNPGWAVLEAVGMLTLAIEDPDGLDATFYQPTLKLFDVQLCDRPITLRESIRSFLMSDRLKEVMRG